MSPGIISGAVLGLLFGIVGRKILDKRVGSFPLHISLGIAGIVVGGLLFDLFAASGVAALNFWNTIVVIMGPRTLCC